MNSLGIFAHVLKILVTGGCGFIGSAFIRKMIHEGHKIINVDKLTYAGDPGTVLAIADSKNYNFIKADICNPKEMRCIFSAHKPDVIVHLAAETHVDRSIDSPDVFIQTNIVGTSILLNTALDYWRRLPKKSQENFRFLHVSTDEVFGALEETGKFTEQTPYDPSSPYSASKAASDHLVRAWHRTYGLPVLITNCSNNYGPFQFPEKLIPTIIAAALAQKPIPIYGNGRNIRDWLYVGDHADALWRVLENGRIGETYNIGGNCEKTNNSIAHEICVMLDVLAGRSDGVSYTEQITFVKDRHGHDFRYAIDADKIQNELGWRPATNFVEGIKTTIQWYLKNSSYLAKNRISKEREMAENTIRENYE